MNVVLLKNSRIDREKYDRCIENSPYGSIYALSWYMDVVSPNWKLLMAEDYTYVMPLPVRWKFGILPYVIQPVLCQQLGLFSIHEVSLKVMKSFLKKIRFPFILFQLNSGNTLLVKNLKLRPNYLLDLNKPYWELQKAYRRDTRYDLKKASANNLFYNKELSVNDFLSFVSEHSKYYSGTIFPYLKKLINAASAHDAMILRSVHKKETGEVLSGVFFLRFKNRYYYLCSVTSLEGKSFLSMRYLLDKFIEEGAGTPMILDFEGSTIPSVALFYESFGSVFENYPRYYKSYLPFVSKVRF